MATHTVLYVAAAHNAALNAAHSVALNATDAAAPTDVLPCWSRHCKKELAIFPSPAGMSLTKLSLGGKKVNYSRPGRV